MLSEVFSLYVLELGVLYLSGLGFYLGGVSILDRGDGLVSGMKGLREGGLLVKGDGRKGIGFGYRCIVFVSFFVFLWKVC